MLYLFTQLVLPLVLALAYIAHCAPLAERAIVVDGVSNLSANYDYVVIGGGTSGLTVANRLTENPQSTSDAINCVLHAYTDQSS